MWTKSDQQAMILSLTSVRGLSASELAQVKALGGQTCGECERLTFPPLRARHSPDCSVA